MKYAIAQIQGHQYQLEEGKTITVDRLAGTAGDQVKIDQVLLMVTDQTRSLGQPTTTKATITAKILEHVSAKKIRVSTYKAKARYRKTHGHRAKQSKILIQSIDLNES